MVLLKKDKSGILQSSLALVIGIVLSYIIVAIIIRNPLKAFSSFFLGTIESSYFLGRFINNAVLLIICALGAMIGMMTGNMNLGGEGQIYLGGFLTAILLNKFEGSVPFWALTLTGFCVITASGLMAAISGVLKVIKHSNVLLTSFLLSSAVIPLLDGAIAGPLRDETGHMLATKAVPSDFVIQGVTSANIILINICIAFLLCFAGSYIMRKTRLGSRIRICGISPRFAEYSGYSIHKADIGGLFCSGACHGLTGFFAITGVYFTCYSGFSSGMGWDALTIALLAESNCLAVIPISFVYSYILSSIDFTVLDNNFGFDISGIIQAIILAFAATNVFIKSRKAAK